MKKCLINVVIFAMIFSLIPLATATDYELFAGNGMYDAGTVTVSNDNTWVYVTIATSPGWCLNESHVQIVGVEPTLPSDMYEKQKDVPDDGWYPYITFTGNPIPGQFEYHNYQEGVKIHYYQIPISEIPDYNSSVPVTVAVHAVVCECALDYECVTVYDSWAVDYEDYKPGEKGSNPVSRYNPDFCLGERDSDGGLDKFTSLGRGGSIVIIFNNSVCDGPGPDLEFYEITNGHNPSWEERVRLELYYDGEWHNSTSFVNNEGDAIGSRTFRNSVELNLPYGQCAEKVKVIDQSTGSSGSYLFDYDIDAVRANYECVPIYGDPHHCETGWGEGQQFYGRNWAMFFNYSIEPLGP
ncbi:hypothetical protein [Methanococcus voltae]|jgi:hypothetical protein|uniref:Uncharacterized protein n=2 Tax=Methanococcus voltae TaxID=2188 RepID=A0A8J7RM16_METVO|nr:hypothetical protein [Methanococcus voltae]MBP2171741.1 hypothetical protein [Methanococcus voltae]MBP2201321.1 hypothetical protein [Methanococcus voltae]MCS3922737.1 hypothetical protein [Methanococcus voltae PS]